MRLRTVLLTETIHPPLAGIGRYAWELAAGLAQQAEAVDVQLLAWGRWHTLEDLQAKVHAAQQGQPSDTLAGKAGPGPRFKGTLKAWLGKQPAVATGYEALRSHLNQRALREMPTTVPTIVHGPDYFAPGSSMPTAVTIHDLSVLLYPQTQPATRVRRFEQLIERAIRSGFTIFTDAQSVANELIAQTGVAAHRVMPVHLGVSQDFRVLAPRACMDVLHGHGLTHGAYVLSVGTAEPRKNLVRLLDAYELLPASNRHLCPLVLAGGKGWNDEALLQRIERAKTAGWLRTLGYVSEAHLPALYAGARLFAYVSLYEGFGLPVAEAMACGTPVITSNCSSMPEVAAGAALLVNPLDVEAISLGLQRSMEDETWRQQARERGLARAAELTWGQTVAATLAVYRKMLAA